MSVVGPVAPKDLVVYGNLPSFRRYAVAVRPAAAEESWDEHRQVCAVEGFAAAAAGTPGWGACVEPQV